MRRRVRGSGDGALVCVVGFDGASRVLRRSIQDCSDANTVGVFFTEAPSLDGRLNNLPDVPADISAMFISELAAVLLRRCIFGTWFAS